MANEQRPWQEQPTIRTDELHELHEYFIVAKDTCRQDEAAFLASCRVVDFVVLA